MPEYILAIETSCDDTSIAIIDTDYHVYSNIISSQPDHNAFGGVVPELASRLHMKNLMHCMEAALREAGLTKQDLKAIAVSINPGLIGSLLVGVSFAKGLAWSLEIPIIAVNHMLGHVFANKIENPQLSPPWLALIVSGGHTELVNFKTEDDFQIVGHTLDDAAGEAFDKTAKLLGLGYPGGPIIDKTARTGNKHFVKFPRALNRQDNYNFSFSGLKTAILQYLNNCSPEFKQEHLADIVASVQAAIVDILVKKTVSYAKKHQINRIIVAGGVSANSYLRQEMSIHAAKIKAEVFFPKLKLCMDNGAMIGAAAVSKYLLKDFSNLSLNAFSTKGIRKI